MKNSEQSIHPSKKVLPENQLNRSAGYIRLLSSILREPPELVAIALRADPPVLIAVAAEHAEAA